MRIGAICIVMLAFVVGCDRSDVVRSSATVPSARAPALSAPTTSTSVLDLSYAQGLLTELFRLEGELMRHVMRARSLDAEFEERLTAIYGGDQLRHYREEFAKDAAIGFVGFAGGDPTAKLLQIIDSSETCMVLEADVDRRPMFTNPISLEPGHVHQLAPGDIERFNPTGWGIVVMGKPRPGSPLEVCE